MSISTKTKTISYGSVKAYAQVKDRLQIFRSENPMGLIETTPEITETMLIFKARIVKDKSNPSSAEATGHSMAEIKASDNKAKIFEKQETIAVGRALALLGYANDGEIASSEEMEEFLQQKQEKAINEVFEVTEAIGNCETLAQLQKVWSSLNGEMKKAVEVAKDAKKAELEVPKKPKNARN